MRQAILVTVVRHPGDGDGASPGAYQAASRSVVRSCDIVLAIWDGAADRRQRGTAETLQTAAARRQAVRWIPTDPAEPVRDNLAPGTSYDFYQQVTALAQVPEDFAGPPRERGELPEDVHPLRESLELLERYNGERGGGAGSPSVWRLNSARPAGEEDWIAPYYLRATLLAAKNQKRFIWSARAIALLAIIAAVMLGVHLNAEFESRMGLGRSGEPGRCHAYFRHPARARVSRSLDLVPVSRRKAAVRPVSHPGRGEPAAAEDHRRGLHRAASLRLGPARVRRVLAWRSAAGAKKAARDRRSGAEAAPRRRLDRRSDQVPPEAKKEHQKWQRILQVTILILFAAAVICAVLDAIRVSRNVTGCLSVAFPAAAASLGALLTVRQHRQLAERSEKMSKDLEEERLELEKAEGRRELASTGARAARIMADESEDWLGALWFLDVEHPG